MADDVHHPELMLERSLSRMRAALTSAAALRGAHHKPRRGFLSSDAGVRRWLRFRRASSFCSPKLEPRHFSRPRWPSESVVESCLRVV